MNILIAIAALCGFAVLIAICLTAPNRKKKIEKEFEDFWNHK